jgi:SAM-dependent methyltransferase
MKSFDPANDAPIADEPQFNAVANDYDRQHRDSIRASGEDPSYFSNYKADCLERARAASPMLDFGCGIGNVTQFLEPRFTQITGYDPSEKSLELARRTCTKSVFTADLESLEQGHFRSIVIANVLHHVAPAERDALLAKVRTLLAPGGRLYVFEHNPLNPLTLKAVRDCPFDADAVLLRRAETEARLIRAGLSLVRGDYIVFMPKAFAKLRSLEPHLAWLPIGAQYMVTAEAVR